MAGNFFLGGGGGLSLFFFLSPSFFVSFMDVLRGHILVPPYIDVNTAPYFDGPEVLKAKHCFVVNWKKQWRECCRCLSIGDNVAI